MDQQPLLPLSPLEQLNSNDTELQLCGLAYLDAQLFKRKIFTFIPRLKELASSEIVSIYQAVSKLALRIAERRQETKEKGLLSSIMELIDSFTSRPHTDLKTSLVVCKIVYLLLRQSITFAFSSSELKFVQFAVSTAKASDISPEQHLEVLEVLQKAANVAISIENVRNSPIGVGPITKELRFHPKILFKANQT
jgi:hypothetical protein